MEKVCDGMPQKYVALIAILSSLCLSCLSMFDRVLSTIFGKWHRLARIIHVESSSGGARAAKDCRTNASTTPSHCGK